MYVHVRIIWSIMYFWNIMWTYVYVCVICIVYRLVYKCKCVSVLYEIIFIPREHAGCIVYNHICTYINCEFVAVELPLEWGHLVLIIKTIVNVYKNGKLETATTISTKNVKFQCFHVLAQRLLRSALITLIILSFVDLLVFVRLIVRPLNLNGFLQAKDDCGLL